MAASELTYVVKSGRRVDSLNPGVLGQLCNIERPSLKQPKKINRPLNVERCKDWLMILSHSWEVTFSAEPLQAKG